MKNNRLDGPVAAWDVKQEMEYYRTFKDGKVDGIWVEWYPSGPVKERCGYLNGKKHGIRIEFFPDGVIATESNYVAGALDGKLVERLAGRKLVTTNWSRGRIVFDRRTCNRRSFLYKIIESDSVYSDPEGTHSTFNSVRAFLASSVGQIGVRALSLR